MGAAPPARPSVDRTTGLSYFTGKGPDKRPATEMETIDTAVIGGGVVGLAAALPVARCGRSVCLLEREPRPGEGTITQNSQVIHAGLQRPAGTLRAGHCVTGARVLYGFCEGYGGPFRRCGKLVVARGDSELATLEALRARGEANGAEGLRIVDPHFIRAREP